jgi:adenylate cyclase, class 2
MDNHNQREIEIKILNINVEEIKKKLLDLGAKEIFNGEVHAILLDFPDKRMINADRFIRVRKVGNQTELCYKGEKEKDSQFKSREEIEVNTNDFETTLKIFKKIGLKEFHEGRKRRESYKINNTRFEIDSWANIPAFLEIESNDKNKIKEYVEKLGYTMENTTTISFHEIEEMYKK